MPEYRKCRDFLFLVSNIGKRGGEQRGIPLHFHLYCCVTLNLLEKKNSSTERRLERKFFHSSLEKKSEKSCCVCVPEGQKNKFWIKYLHATVKHLPITDLSLGHLHPCRYDRRSRRSNIPPPPLHSGRFWAEDSTRRMKIPRTSAADWTAETGRCVTDPCPRSRCASVTQFWDLKFDQLQLTASTLSV